MKKIIVIAVISSIFMSSCKKCMQCYMVESYSQAGTTTTTPLGEKCGQELKDIEGETHVYIGNSGPVITYCIE